MAKGKSAKFAKSPESKGKDVSNTDYAEGRLYEFLGADAVRTDLLETFPYKGSRQRVLYKTREFSAVCPFSGLPDFSTVWVRYVPGKLVVELKSLKYYFQSFRQVGMFQEDVTNRIYEDLHRLLKPEYLKVKTRYNIRGGIDTTCVVVSKDQR